MLLPWYIYVGSSLVTFGAVFLKGFQHMNVIHRRMKLIFVTSILMQMFDYAIMSIVAVALYKSYLAGGITVGTVLLAFTSGVTAGCAMLTSIWSSDTMAAWYERKYGNVHH